MKPPNPNHSFLGENFLVSALFKALIDCHEAPPNPTKFLKKKNPCCKVFEAFHSYHEPNLPTFPKEKFLFLVLEALNYCHIPTKGGREKNKIKNLLILEALNCHILRTKFSIY